MATKFKCPVVINVRIGVAVSGKSYKVKWPRVTQKRLNRHFVASVYLKLKNRFFIDFSAKISKNWLKTKGHKWQFRRFWHKMCHRTKLKVQRRMKCMCGGGWELSTSLVGLVAQSIPVA